MNDKENLGYWYWLFGISGIGPVNARKILGVFKEPDIAFNTPSELIVNKSGIRDSLIPAINNAKARLEEYMSLAEMQLQRASAIEGAQILVGNRHPYADLYWQHEYEQALPGVIHAIGNTLLLGDRMVAIVGTRRPSDLGKMRACSLAREVTKNNMDVISGLASGIDVEGHRGALETGGRTLAVLGCGADVPYPSENLKEYKQICEKGLVISEFPFGTRISADNLRQRNRSIIAFAERIVIAQCPLKSGAMIAARFAVQQGKTIFCFRDDDSELNSGGQWLLAHHLAQGISSDQYAPVINDLLESFAPDKTKANKLFEEIWPKKKLMRSEPPKDKPKKRSTTPMIKGKTKASRMVKGIPKQVRAAGATQPEMFTASDTFTPGDRVVHPVFGQGLVVGMTKYQEIEISIKFEKGPVRRLSLKYANLQKVPNDYRPGDV